MNDTITLVARDLTAAIDDALEALKRAHQDELESLWQVAYDEGYEEGLAERG